MDKNEILKAYQIEEEIIVENKQAFAYSSLLNSKRAVNGCKSRRYLNGEIDKLEIQKEELEAQLKDVIEKMTQYKALDNQLAGVGYCKIDNPVFQKIDGMIVKDAQGNAKILSYTHSQVCLHKKEE